jgi:hypothetical protein
MATAEAAARGHRHLGAEHPMLAILAEGGSVPAQVLRRRVPLNEAYSDLDAAMHRPSYGPGTRLEGDSS